MATGPEFAVLTRSDAGWCQFVAGGGEDRESPEEAAARETKEEIGINAAGVLLALDSTATVPKDCFAAAASWSPDIYVIPEHCFAVDVGDRVLTLSGEHTALQWVSYEEAAGLLKWDSNRNALWELNERLKRAADNGGACYRREARRGMNAVVGRHEMKTTHRNIGPACITVLLTIASLWIIIESAQNEPYFTLMKYDAFTQIGVACVLITGWLLFAAWLVSRICNKRLSALWLTAIIWIVIVLFYLHTSPLDFLSDLAQFHGAQ